MPRSIPNPKPTGFSPHDLPLFETLDDHGFESFCRALLDLRPTLAFVRNGRLVERTVIACHQLLGGQDQRGADLRATLDGGLEWFFQCKRVKSFTPAQVIDAVQQLESGFPNADGYCLVTSCGLGNAAIDALCRRPDWQWWDASRLTTLVQNLSPPEAAITLVHRFFGNDQAKRILPWPDLPYLDWEAQFTEDLEDSSRLFHHQTPFIDRGGCLDRLRTFAQANEGSALVMSAAGGQGKSRLLLEFARSLEPNPPDPQGPRVRFLNLRRTGLSESQRNALLQEKNLLLVVEDGHRLDHEVGDLAALTSANRALRLLVATRPQSAPAVRRRLAENGYSERIEELALPDWQTQDLQDLAQKALKTSGLAPAARLARLADGCPLLVVLGASLVRTGRLAESLPDEPAFRDRVVSGFLEGFLDSHPEPTRTLLRRIIEILCLVTPAPLDEHLVARIADLTNSRSLDVHDDLDRLRAARLVVKNPEGIRVYPDLLADAVVQRTGAHNGRKPSPLLEQVLERFPAEQFPSTLRNLAQADWSARQGSETTHPLFDPLWTKFRARYEAADPPGRERLMDQWSNFGVFLPASSLQLARVAIQRASLEGNSPPRALLDTLTSIVLSHPDRAPAALDLLWDLEARFPTTPLCADRAPMACIAQAGSFAVEKSLQTSISVIEWLRPHLTSPEGHDRIRACPGLVSDLLGPLFARVIDYRTWVGGHDLCLSKRAIKLNVTRPVRQQALQLAKELAMSSDPVLAIAAIPVLAASIVCHGLPGEQIHRSKLQRAWRNERLDALNAIEEVIRHHHGSHRILLALRKRLIRATQYESDSVFAAACTDARRRIPESIELNLARAMTSGFDDELDGPADPKEPDPFGWIEARWADFCRSVATDLWSRWPNPDGLMGRIEEEARELRGLRMNVEGSELAWALASVSAARCAAVLGWLVDRADGPLDPWLPVVLRAACTSAPQHYERALAQLPSHPAATKVTGLVDHLSTQFERSGQLSPIQTSALLACATRHEPPLPGRIAWWIQTRFHREPVLALQLLSRLEPQDADSLGSYVHALAVLAKAHPEILEPQALDACLTKLDLAVLAKIWPGADREFMDSLTALAARFPIPTYRHFQRLSDLIPVGHPSHERAHLASLIPPFPRIETADFVDTELATQWAAAWAHPESTELPLALIRAIIVGDPATQPSRMRTLIDWSPDGRQLEWVARLAAGLSKHFVFDHPEFIRALLEKSSGTVSAPAVHEVLWQSGFRHGSRAWTDNELNPEYRYILDRSQLLANRYQSDPILGPFYRSLAEAESRHRDIVNRAPQPWAFNDGASA